MSTIPVVERRGARMPALGFGTFRMSGDTVRHMVENALEIGYRHIDTAQIYGNEREVGRAIATSAVPRDELFVTTKVWVDRFEPRDLRASVQESLERLATSYVDLLLLHWPAFPGGAMRPTLEALMEVKRAGHATHIGVSNFNIAQLREAESVCGDALVTNQVEYHVYLGQNRLKAAMDQMGYVTTAYLPLARGRVAQDETLAEIGRRYGKTAAQVALRWLVEQDGVAAIPATTKPARCRENFEIFDFALTGDDRARVTALTADVRLCSPSELAPRWDD